MSAVDLIKSLQFFKLRLSLAACLGKQTNVDDIHVGEFHRTFFAGLDSPLSAVIIVFGGEDSPTNVWNREKSRANQL